VAEGQLLTMTAREAEEFGFLDRSFEGRRFPRDERELLAALGAPDARIEHVRMSFAEEASRVLLQFAAILGAVVTLSLMLLLFQGPGVMTIVGGVALGLTILIHLTAGLVHGFPLFLLLVGALLLAVEILLIPGFGIPGILGIVSMAAGFLFLAAGTTLGDAGSLTGDLALDFAWKFVVTAIVGFAAVLLASRWFPKMGPGRRLLLAGPAGTPPAPVAGPPLPAKGEIGVARSPLRPAGTAEFDGRLVDVVSDGPLVETGERVRVSRVEGRIVTVLPAEGPPR
jgi:membrane-bound serine protease (ClpP class)